MVHTRLLLRSRTWVLLGALGSVYKKPDGASGPCHRNVNPLIEAPWTVHTRLAIEIRWQVWSALVHRAPGTLGGWMLFRVVVDAPPPVAAYQGQRGTLNASKFSPSERNAIRPVDAIVKDD